MQHESSKNVCIVSVAVTAITAVIDNTDKLMRQAVPI